MFKTWISFKKNTTNWDQLAYISHWRCIPLTKQVGNKPICQLWKYHRLYGPCVESKPSIKWDAASIHRWQRLSFALQSILSNSSFYTRFLPNRIVIILSRSIYPLLHLQITKYVPSKSLIIPWSSDKNYRYFSTIISMEFTNREQGHQQSMNNY